MSVSGISCLNHFFAVYQEPNIIWSDNHSLDFQPITDHDAAPKSESSFQKSSELQAEQTTFKSGKKDSSDTIALAYKNTIYSLQEDIAILTRVSNAKNKLSAKKFVAQQLGRSYSGILNRYQILKNLSPAETEQLFEMAKSSENNPQIASISAVVKRTGDQGLRKCRWRLSHFLVNGVRVELPAETVEKEPTENPAIQSSKFHSPQKSKEKPIGKKLRKRECSKISRPKIRGPYKTRHMRELEVIKGQGSELYSSFLINLLESGLQSKAFTPEEVLEGVFEKHRHSPALIETVLSVNKEAQ